MQTGSWYDTPDDDGYVDSNESAPPSDDEDLDDDDELLPCMCFQSFALALHMDCPFYHWLCIDCQFYHRLCIWTVDYHWLCVWFVDFTIGSAYRLSILP